MLALLAVALVGCNSSAMVRTGLTARTGPIDAKGFRIEAKILPLNPRAKVRMATITATAPSHWKAPFELMLTSDGDPDGGSGSSSISTRTVSLTTSVSPSFEKGDDRVFGRIALFVTAYEDLTFPGGFVEEVAPGRYVLRLEKPVELMTKSGYIVTFPIQEPRDGGDVSGSPSSPVLKVRCRMNGEARMEALAGLIPVGRRPVKTTATLLDARGQSRSWSRTLSSGSDEFDVEMTFDYPSKKKGKIGPFALKVRHRADIETIPFAIIAQP